MCDQQSLRSASAYAQSDHSLCLSLEYSMSVKLLTEHHLVFLSLKGGCTGSSESTLVKMPHCWKSHVTAHYLLRVPFCTAYCKSGKNRENFILSVDDSDLAVSRGSYFHVNSHMRSFAKLNPRENFRIYTMRIIR